jgi:RNA polymerase sigma factor (sigma-70 family)
MTRRQEVLQATMVDQPCVVARPGTLPGESEWTPPSWDEVVREHADRVYRLAYRLSGNRHDAEDLTQETFIRVFKSLANYHPGTFEGWLHRITTNLFLDMVRRRARVRMDGLPEDTDRLPGGGPEPEKVWSDTHLDPSLQASLDELPPEFRAAVVLCDVEGLSYEEIGATLGVKLGTVRSRIHRGRTALRASLERRSVQRGVKRVEVAVGAPGRTESNVVESNVVESNEVWTPDVAGPAGEDTG